MRSFSRGTGLGYRVFMMKLDGLRVQRIDFVALGVALHREYCSVIKQ